MLEFRSKKISIIISYVYLGMNMIVGLFLSSFLVKSLGATDYGVYQIVTSFTSYLSLLNFGSGTIMTRNIVAAKVDSDQSEIKNIATIIFMSGCICIIIFLLSVVLYTLIDDIYKNSLTAEQIFQAKPMFIVVSLNLIVSILLQTFEGIIHGNDDYTMPKLVALVRVLLRLVLMVCLVNMFKNAMTVVLVDFSLSIIIAMFDLLYCRKWYRIGEIFDLKKFDYAIFKIAISFAAAMILQVFVNQAITQLPKFVIGVAISPEAVTTFSIAIYIYNMFASIVTVPVGIFLPTTVRAVVNKEQSNWDFLIKPCRLNSLCGGILLFGFIALGRPFVILMYGLDQEFVWVAAIILLVPMYLNMVNAVSVNVLDALNKRLVRSIIVAVTAGVSLLCTVLFIKTLGMIVAIVSIGVSLLVGNTIVMSIYYKKAIGIDVISLYLKAFKGILPSCIIAATAVYCISSYCSVSWFNFGALGILFVAVLFVCLATFGLSRNEKDYFVQQFKRIVKK